MVNIEKTMAEYFFFHNKNNNFYGPLFCLINSRQLYYFFIFLILFYDRIGKLPVENQYFVGFVATHVSQVAKGYVH